MKSITEADSKRLDRRAKILIVRGEVLININLLIIMCRLSPLRATLKFNVNEIKSMFLISIGGVSLIRWMGEGGEGFK